MEYRFSVTKDNYWFAFLPKKNQEELKSRIQIIICNNSEGPIGSCLYEFGLDFSCAVGIRLLAFDDTWKYIFSDKELIEKLFSSDSFGDLSMVKAAEKLKVLGFRDVTEYKENKFFRKG